MPDTPTPDSDPQIQQDVKGNENQTIGQVLGGLVVYGTVIYHNPPASEDVATDRNIEIGANPYKGLLAFQETDGDRFFGRDPQIHELWEKFRTLHEDESATRLLVIYGPSGSGKSSLARAGLIPELAREPLPGSDHARVAVMVPGSHPLEALATVLARIATEDATPVAKTREFAAELKAVNSEGVYDGLRRIGDALPEIATKPLIVLVDQLEEVFTLCADSAERDAFVGNLLCAAADRSKRVSVIVTLRSDFLGATQKYPRLNQLIASPGYFVAAMSAAGLREAITKPAEMAGHPLDLSTVDRLIEQTEGREGALPLLQFSLTRIWVGLGEGKEPAQTLSAIGGVGGALAGEAQRIYESLPAEEQEIARRVFLGLVQLGEGSKDTRRRTELARVVSHRDNVEQVRKVIGRFSAPGARLITLANEGGAETAEVTHEALFDHWQQMKVWLDGSRSDLRFQRRLDEAAMVWQGNGRPEGNLWKAPDLDLLRRYQERARDYMTPLQLEFFQAADRSEIEQKRLMKLNKLATLSSLVLTTGTTILLAALFHQSQSQRLGILGANASNLLAFNQPVNSTINAIAAQNLGQSAWLKFPVPDHAQVAFIDGILLNTVWIVNPEQNQLRHDSTVISVAYSPDGQRAVSGSGDKTVRIWDAKTGKLIGKPLLGHTESVHSVAFSPDGQKIASGSRDKTVRIWDAKTGKPLSNPFPLSGDLSFINSVAYSPDSQHIVSGSYDNTIQIWDANTGEPIGKPLLGHKDGVSSVTYSPDGQHIVSGGYDKTIRIWDVKTRTQIGKPLQGHRSIVSSVAYSPDGQRIVSGSNDRTIRIWDTKTRLPIGEPIEGHELAVKSVAFSPDGQRIVSGSDDRTIRIWDAKTRFSTGQSLKGHEDLINSVAFSPDSKHIISSGDKTARIWQVRILEPVTKKLKGHEDLLNSVAFSPDGQRIISIKSDGTLLIWDVQTGILIGQPLLLQGNKKSLTSLAVSPDGQQIVTGSFGGLVQVWNAKTGSLIHNLWQYRRSYLTSVVYSPDGQQIVSSGDDMAIRIWDAKTGASMSKPLFLKGHKSYLTSIAISPDGKNIISGSKDWTIRIWDAKTGASIGKSLQGHHDEVKAVAYSPDGQHIVSNGDDMKIRIWDAKTGASIGQPLKNDSFGQFTAVAYNQTGQRIVSVSSDKTMRSWDVSKESLLRIACDRLRYHPSLTQPTTDVAREAKQTCEQYAWKK
jgi:WD40 repeat protein